MSIFFVLLVIFKNSYSQKSEIIGELTSSQFISSADSDITIMVGNVSILINGTTVFNVKFNASKKDNTKLEQTSRVRIFYKTENGINIAYKIVSEKIFVNYYRLILPIPKYIPPTAISGIGMGNLDDLGKITSWGWGVGAEMRAYQGLRLFFDVAQYSYKQVLAEKGEKVHSLNNFQSSLITLQMGAKYVVKTTPIRLGIKYVMFRDKNIQPWIAIGYALNVWQMQYTSFDEQKIYGKANGTVGRSSILFGIDFKKMATISLFYEAISPVANYSIDLPAFGGSFSTFEGMTFPTPRIGISIGGF